MAINRTRYINDFGFRGAYLDVPPDLAPDGAIVGGFNYRVRRGRLEPRKGMSLFGDYTAQQPTTATAINYYKNVSGTITIVARINATLYAYSGSTWVDIDGSGISSGLAKHQVANFYDVDANENILIAQGSNRIPIKWDGNTSNDVEYLGGLDENLAYTHVAQLGGHLILANVTDRSPNPDVNYPNHLVWSDLNKPEIWPTEFNGSGGGTCGYAELYSTPGGIKFIAPFQDYLVIGKEDAFVLMSHTGSAYAPFHFQWITKEIGTPFASYAILPSGMGVVTYDDIYLFQGTNELKSIATDRVRKSLFDNIYDISSEYMSSVYDPREKEWHIFIVTGTNDSQTPDTVMSYVYNIAEDVWEIDRLPYNCENPILIDDIVYSSSTYAIYKWDESLDTIGTAPDTDYIDNGNCQGTSPPIMTGETTLYGWNSTTKALSTGTGSYDRSADRGYLGQYSWKVYGISSSCNVYFTDNIDNNDIHGLDNSDVSYLQLIYYCPKPDDPDNELSVLYSYWYDSGEGKWDYDNVMASVMSADLDTYDQWAVAEVVLGYNGNTVEEGWYPTLLAKSTIYIGSIRIVDSSESHKLDSRDIPCQAETKDYPGANIDSYDKYVSSRIHYMGTGNSDNLDVSLSSDGGNTWETQQSIDLSGSTQRESKLLGWNTTGRTARLRYIGQNFEVYGHKIGYVPQGKR